MTVKTTRMTGTSDNHMGKTTMASIASVVPSCWCCDHPQLYSNLSTVFIKPLSWSMQVFEVWRKIEWFYWQWGIIYSYSLIIKSSKNDSCWTPHYWLFPNLFFFQLLPLTFTIAASWLLLFAIAINVTAHCNSTTLMPPWMLLLAVAIPVDCYFAAALVCDFENGPKPPTPMTPLVVPPTPRPMVPIPPTARPTIPPLTPCFEQGIVVGVLLQLLWAPSPKLPLFLHAADWFFTKYFVCCCGAFTACCTGANAISTAVFAGWLILPIDCCFFTKNAVEVVQLLLKLPVACYAIAKATVVATAVVTGGWLMILHRRICSILWLLVTTHCNGTFAKITVVSTAIIIANVAYATAVMIAITLIACWILLLFSK